MLSIYCVITHLYDIMTYCSKTDDLHTVHKYYVYLCPTINIPLKIILLINTSCLCQHSQVYGTALCMCSLIN